MVKGIDLFKEHFKGHVENYRIIGGTAFDVIITRQGFDPRATQDIDLIIVLEKYNTEFNKKLREFIKDAGYESLQKDMKEQCFYRFCKPFNKEYPFQLELICRDPNVFHIPANSNISPIDLDEDFSHLSIMEMDDEYYEFTLKNSFIVDDLFIASPESLICLKALAYQNLMRDKKAGKQVNDGNITKHKNDVFRLSLLLDQTAIDVPENIKNNLESFLVIMEQENPDINNLLRHMKVEIINLENLITSIRHKFRIIV
ncbi:MAG: hypothetical protein WCA84_10850 [Ignavibacteriaceae bacterium]